MGKIIDNNFKMLNRQVYAIQSDFMEKNSPENFLNLALEKLGNNADILVNCAATYKSGSLLEMDPELFAMMHKLNVEIPLRLIQKFSHYLISHKRLGNIINSIESTT